MKKMEKSEKKHLHGNLQQQSVQSPIVNFPTILARSDKFNERCKPTLLLEDQIFTLEHFLTNDNNRNFLAFFQSMITPILNPPVAPKRGEATRTSERFSIYDPLFAERLFRDTNLDSTLTELPAVIQSTSYGNTKRLVGLNPNIRIYRYLPGTFFGPHYDDSVTDPGTGWKSEWTLLIYLTEGDFQGGQTSFEVKRDQFITPEIVSGNALIHRHGQHCLKHEGRPVLSGVKWVLRSDLMYA